jgi:hypothetical protein
MNLTNLYLFIGIGYANALHPDGFWNHISHCLLWLPEVSELLTIKFLLPLLG